VRVPNDVDLGKATITVSVPAWKERVTPLQVLVPVVAEKHLTEKAGK